MSLAGKHILAIWVSFKDNRQKALPAGYSSQSSFQSLFVGPFPDGCNETLDIEWIAKDL
jgi:hypothetical protein